MTWRQKSAKTSPIPLPMAGTGKPSWWFANDSEAKLMIAFESTSIIFQRMRKMETIKSHLYNKRAGYLSRITGNFEEARRPKPPFDAVIHSPYNTRFFPSCFVSPFLFPSFSVSSNCPPEGFKTGLNFAIRQLLIVLVGNFHATWERLGYLVCYMSCAPFRLKFIEIGRFKWPSITETEKGRYPTESN